jgi:hypothetical protein
MPATAVDDLLAWADYDASRQARWRKDAEWMAERDSKRREVKDTGKGRARLGPKHVSE